jgi:hypothetical protein
MSSNPESRSSETSKLGSGATNARAVPPVDADGFTSERAASSLLHALGLLSRRGIGGLAWSTPFHDDPIAFMLDSMNDALNVWDADGKLVFQNRTALGLGLGQASDAAYEVFSSGGRRFERRCQRCRARGQSFVLEIIHEVPARDGSERADTDRGSPSTIPLV